MCDEVFVDWDGGDTAFGVFEADGDDFLFATVKIVRLELRYGEDWTYRNEGAGLDFVGMWTRRMRGLLLGLMFISSDDTLLAFRFRVMTAILISRLVKADRILEGRCSKGRFKVSLRERYRSSNVSIPHRSLDHPNSKLLPPYIETHTTYIALQKLSLRLSAYR